MMITAAITIIIYADNKNKNTDESNKNRLNGQKQQGHNTKNSQP